MLFLLLFASVAIGLVASLRRPFRLPVLISALLGGTLTLGGLYLFWTPPVAIAVNGTDAVSPVRVHYGPVRCDDRFDGFPLPGDGSWTTKVIEVEQAQVCVPARRMRTGEAWSLVVLGQLLLWSPQMARGRRRNGPWADTDEPRRLIATARP